MAAFSIAAGTSCGNEDRYDESVYYNYDEEYDFKRKYYRKHHNDHGSSSEATPKHVHPVDSFMVLVIILTDSEQGC